MNIKVNYYLIPLLLICSLINFLLFFCNWGGDPEIHIIFAKNFLNLNFLEFNPGLKTSGETSLIYMFLVSIFTFTLPDPLLPWLMKATGLISLIYCIKLLTEEIHSNYKIIFALSILTIPSIFFQSFLGMENFLFAAYVLFTLNLFLNSKMNSFKVNHFLKISALGLIGYYIRPEMLCLTTGILVTSLILRKINWTAGALFSFLLIFITQYTLEHLTGAPLHGAGEVRSLWGEYQSLKLNIFNFSLFINKKPLYYILTTLPFLFLFAIKFLKNPMQTLKLPNQTSLILLFGSVGLGPFVLHALNIFPNTHFSRYQLYMFFGTIFLLLKYFNLNQQQTKNFITSMSLLSLVIFSIEHFKRDFDSNKYLSISNFNKITNYTSTSKQSKISNSLCKVINCSLRNHNVIAVQEVQIRLQLDDRFIVRSLDGIVDYKLKNFVSDGCVNYLDYIKFRKIDAILEFPNYSPKNVDCPNSLTKIYSLLESGKSFAYEDISILPRTWNNKTIGVIKIN